MGALHGLKVIDLTHVMAGPTCTMLLADLGADVIKVEKVPGGDDTRRIRPPQVGDESGAFLMMNRNKRGIALDLKTEDGRAVLHRLIAGADILVENYRHDTLAKLGFTFDEARKSNPGLIWCALSGFGRTGPYAGRGGFDLVAQAMSGIMSITGTSRDDPPMKCGPPLTDITAGLLAAIGILAALQARNRTGRGQIVDTSLFEAGIIQTYWQSAIALASGESPGPLGSAHPLNAPYQAFRTADGWIVVGGANQSNWLRLTKVLGAPELAEDPRFRENAGRMTHRAELEAALTAHFETATSAEWLARLEAAGVPAGPVNSITEMLDDPQTLAREMVVELPHAALGKAKALGLPIKLSETPGGPERGAPVYGEHTREVLREHGYDDAAIDGLLRNAAIVTASV